MEQLNQIKYLMELNEPNTIGPTTLQKFLQLCQELNFDLSKAGVNAFKNQNKLGNSGTVKGIIGPQTARVYYEKIISKTSPTSSSTKGREINQTGLHLIAEFEGLAKKLPDGKIAAYSDAVGIPTIGYGHTHGVYIGQVITKQQAQEFLQQDLRQAEFAVNSLVKVTLNDDQFAALVSFVFNLGAGAFHRSTLLILLNLFQNLQPVRLEELARRFPSPI